MKGINGLIIAALLGIAGAVCNFVYIRNEAAGYEKVAFVAIKTGAQINPGDPIREEDIERVEIPKANLGNIERIAVRWEDRQAALDWPAVKSYEGGELLLQSDVLTPSVARIEDRLREGETNWSVPVDSKLFVAEHYNPGEEVYFFAPASPPRNEPELATSGNAQAEAPKSAGPFRILAIGARTGSAEVQRTTGRRTSAREDVVVVPLKFDGNQITDEPSQKLKQMTEAYKGQGLIVAKKPAGPVRTP